jgi:hypothetical protein
MNRALLLPLSAWAAVASTPSSAAPPEHGRRTIFASVGWSEWCPPGFAYVDLDSGRYRWIVQRLRPECGHATSAPVEEGQLAPNQQRIIRRAAERGLREGLISANCREGRQSPDVVISNASEPYILIVSTPRDAMSAPNDLTCWSDAATGLQRAMERIFDVPARLKR